MSIAVAMTRTVKLSFMFFSFRLQADVAAGFVRRS